MAAKAVRNIPEVVYNTTGGCSPEGGIDLILPASFLISSCITYLTAGVAMASSWKIVIPMGPTSWKIVIPTSWKLLVPCGLLPGKYSYPLAYFLDAAALCTANSLAAAPL